MLQKIIFGISRTNSFPALIGEGRPQASLRAGMSGHLGRTIELPQEYRINFSHERI